MIKILFSLHLIFFSISFACDGGLALNKKQLSISPSSSLANDITLVEFKKIISDFNTFFGPLVENDFQRELIIFSSWASNTVNAFAEQKEDKVMITIFGGLARHKSLSRDGLVVVLYHELGHHFGGYPKKNTNRWSSAEGQADYFASMKCLRRFWRNQDNVAAIRNISIPQKLKDECLNSFDTLEDQSLCQRMGMAGHSVSLMIQDLDSDSIEPRFETPDPLVARTINYSHPYAQCRLDTYFQGAICTANEFTAFDDDDEKVGSCHQRHGDVSGLRPQCWFVSQN